MNLTSEQMSQVIHHAEQLEAEILEILGDDLEMSKMSIVMGICEQLQIPETERTVGNTITLLGWIRMLEIIDKTINRTAEQS